MLAPSSSAENVNVADVLLVSGSGPVSIDVSGAIVSTVQVCDAGEGSVLPAWSVACTRSVCSPSARSAYDVVHAAYGAPSSEHSNVVPSSSAENANVADVLRVSASGPESMLVSGGFHSALQNTPLHWAAWPLRLAALRPPSIVPGPALIPKPRLSRVSFPVTMCPPLASVMPSAPLAFVVFCVTVLAYEPPPSSIPIPAPPTARLPETRFRLDPSTCRPPGLAPRSLSTTRPSLAVSSEMPASDIPCVLLPTSSLRSDSLTRMPVSPESVIVLPSTRLSWEPCCTSIPPSLVPDTTLCSSTLPVERSSPMPRSPPPTTRLPSSRLRSESRSSSAPPELSVSVLSETIAPVVPLSSSRPPPLFSSVFPRISLPSRASKSRIPDTSLWCSQRLSTSPPSVSARSCTPWSN